MILSALTVAALTGCSIIGSLIDQEFDGPHPTAIGSSQPNISPASDDSHLFEEIGWEIDKEVFRAAFELV